MRNKTKDEERGKSNIYLIRVQEEGKSQVESIFI